MKMILRLMLCWTFVAALPAVVQAQDYTYTTNNGTITITKYIGSNFAASIPASIGGLPVVGVGSNAFFRRLDLLSITIPESVTHIGTSAFSGCENLRRIAIPASVTSIGSEAFAKGDRLTGVYFRGNAPSIGASVFEGSSGDVTVYYLPGTTGWNTTFGDRPAVLWPYAYPYISDNGSITIVAYAGPGGEVTIPNTIEGQPVTCIGEEAFSDCGAVTSITIPNSTTNIEQSAFGGNDSLTSVTIPDSVTSIGDWAFHENPALTNVTIGSNVGNIGTRAFAQCRNLPHVTIPSSVTNIGSWAFSGCTTLTGVHFKGNAPRTGEEVFSASNHATVYHLPGTTGWGRTFCGRPTALWNPPVASNTASGVRPH